MTTITIASIEQKPKKWMIHTTEGRKLGCWANNVGKFGLEQGATFEVETETNDYGTLIIKATRAAGAPPITHTLPSNGEGGSPGHTGQSAFRTPEQMFVSEILTAYINSGRCEPDKLTQHINYIRTAWNRTFGGNDGTFSASEAGSVGRAA